MPAFKHDDTSPVLFLNVKGEPMRFYVRPGPSKVQLQPLIARSGGIVCRTQEPSAVLLADPLELSAIAEGFGQFYVSTQYVLDCVAQNQQLDIEPYRINNIQPIQTRLATRKRHSMGRMGYSLEDDMAILNYINKRKTDAKGNKVWKEMEQKHVTSHSWQSMKDRYLKHLQYKELTLSPKKGKVTPVRERSPTQSTGAETGRRTSSRTRAIVTSSDSDESDGNAVDQPAPETSSEIRPSSQSSDSGENKPSHSENDDAQNPPLLSEQQPHECQNLSEQPAVSNKRTRTETEEEATQEESNSSDRRRKGRKSSKPSKRKLGILERAAQEFEESQTFNDGSQDTSLHSQSSMGSDTDEAQIRAARARAMREDDVVSGSPKGAEQKSKRCRQGSEADDAGPSGAAPVMSNTHMFLFQHESQEDQSQPPELDSNTDDLLEAQQHVVTLMKKSKKALPDVMKALLKNSGDTTLALSYLLKGYDPTVHGPNWTRLDDEILLSGDASKRSLLDMRYGAEGVSRRIRFLTAN